MKRILCISAILLLLFSGCKNKSGIRQIIIFHAGSLSVPLKEMASEYRKKHPEVKILLEPAGSIVCARKITELKKPCDIVASADHFVIDELLIPGYASWSIRFATNEIVIAFSEKSKYSREINSSNWMEILMRDDVVYARSDPDSDPCGYRSELMLMLAEKYYGIKGLSGKFMSKNREFMRPKEVDLVALVEAGAADYMFQYRSVAIQHNLRYIKLPDEINLSDPARNDIYRSVSVDVRGSSPEDKMRVTGEFINYSLTIPFNAPDNSEAVNFLEFLLSPEGLEIFRKNGQDPIIPFSTDQPGKIPGELLKYLNSI